MLVFRTVLGHQFYDLVEISSLPWPLKTIIPWPLTTKQKAASFDKLYSRCGYSLNHDGLKRDCLRLSFVELVLLGLVGYRCNIGWYGPILIRYFFWFSVSLFGLSPGSSMGKVLSSSFSSSSLLALSRFSRILDDSAKWFVEDSFTCLEISLILIKRHSSSTVSADSISLRIVSLERNSLSRMHYRLLTDLHNSIVVREVCHLFHFHVNLVWDFRLYYLARNLSGLKFLRWSSRH